MHPLDVAVWAGFAVSLAYAAFATARVALFRRRDCPASTYCPPVTIAKPVCGMDARLEENLRSFLVQDYPRHQVVFGALDPGDPAISAVRQVQTEARRRDTLLTIDGCPLGGNPKVRNLIGISRHAKHDIIVASDSDIRVGPGYLQAIAGPFEDERVGAVTCLYVAEPVGGAPSTLGAMHINEEFLPSILVSLALQPLSFCFGSTMAARRSALDAIGGFEALAGYLADDYMLGRLMTQRGLRVALASCVVTNVVRERSLKELFLHELRWARTIRRARPLGYSATIFTMTVAWALAVLLASRFSAAGWAALAIAFSVRVLLQAAVRARFRLRGAPPVWWIPAREALTFAVWCASHLGQSVLWRENRFRVGADGRLHEQEARA